MESLLANYGSDDEEDEVPQEPPSSRRASLFTSLPPPKISGEDPARRSSLFASLPRPKFAGEDTWTSNVRVSNERLANLNEEENEEDKLSEAPFLAVHTYAGDAFTDRDTNESSKTSDDAFKVSVLNTKVSEDDANRKYADLNGGDISGASKSNRVSLFGVLPPPQKTGSSLVGDVSGASKRNRASLFGALPPPKNTGSPLVPLVSQPLSARSSKPLIQVRPNIDMSLLKDADDDDDYPQPKAKRHTSDAVGNTKATGLAAILPKPKNVERTLGSGYASGHHATLDVEASENVEPSLSMVINSESASHAVHDPSSYANEHSFETGRSNRHVGQSHVSSSSGAWEGYNQDVRANLLAHSDAVQFDAPSNHFDFVLPEGGEVLCSEDYHNVPEGYSEGSLEYETSDSPMSNAQDPIAHMLLKERRRGGKNASPNIIEVKQTDLTATKLREDQLRITGIAFGPAYRPISTSKGKPSKLHRRKHQIGSLYYDMKQKEMELIERRARGHMTKAETQGKYGW